AGTTAKEIGAQIIRTASGLFQAINVTVGTTTHVSMTFSLPKTTASWVTVAWFHSHPPGSGAVNYRLSAAGEGIGGENDIGTLKKLKKRLGFAIDALLGTPGGGLLSFGPPEYAVPIQLFPDGCVF
ncbi:MAG: hypothetical protein D6694_13335, partial [Gammaproteobacteria bacterium]